MQVKYVFAKKFIDAKPVLEKALPYITGSVGVITTIQYLHLMKEVKQFFEDKKISCEILGQVLGCNTKVADSSNADTILFFGDGMFHPKAMSIRKEKMKVILADPLSNIVREMKEDELKVFENRRYAALAKFYSSENIGVLTTLKPGQEQVKAALNLKKQFPDKKIYILLFDDLNWSSLEDFPFVECFINTMCPRIAYDDYHKVPRPVVDYLDLLEFEKNRNDGKKITVLN